MLLKELGEEETYYYHPDHLGSVSVVSNHKGEPYERVEYLPFGEVWIEETDPATSYIPFRFTSKEYDEETGLYYYGARYYEPRLSRWMSADPAGWELINPMDEDGEPVPDGWPEGFGPGPRVGMRPGYSVIEAANWYAYVSNNPVKYVDPTGEEIALQVHHVAFGKYHISLKITPDDQEADLSNRDDKGFKTDDDGNKYITIGAGPNLRWDLKSKINRRNDLNKRKVETVILDIGDRDENDVIRELLNTDVGYRDDARYKASPKGGVGHNSNSYISGLLKKVGLDPPELESNTPGYDKPLPEEYFIIDTWMLHLILRPND